MPDKHFTFHAMLQAAATRAEQVLVDFTPQAVSNLMWAFAALSHNPGLLLHTCTACHSWQDHCSLLLLPRAVGSQINDCPPCIAGTWSCEDRLLHMLPVVST